MKMTVIQQHILHYFNLMKVASFKSTLEVYKKVLREVNVNETANETDLHSAVNSINETLKAYDLEIAESIDEITSEKLFILINTADNFVTQKAKFYDHSTIQAFSKIIRECIISEKGYCSETHCLNLSSSIGISKAVVQNIIEKLVKDKWLMIKEGNICLGMRTIVELEQNIKQLYPDEIKHCPFCKLFIVQGFICSNCKLRCHFACLNRYLTISKSNSFCPECKENWNDATALNNTANSSSRESEEEEEEDAEESPVMATGKKKRRV